jgi:hypothetical protein
MIFHTDIAILLPKSITDTAFSRRHQALNTVYFVAEEYGYRKARGFSQLTEVAENRVRLAQVFRQVATPLVCK